MEVLSAVSQVVKYLYNDKWRCLVGDMEFHVYFEKKVLCPLLVDKMLSVFTCALVCKLMNKLKVVS